MKLLIVTAVKAYETKVLDLFKKSRITAFSSGEIHGFKTEEHVDLVDNWFSGPSDKVRSVLFFTFAGEDAIRKVMDEVRAFNLELSSDNPMRAIVLPIEKFV